MIEKDKAVRCVGNIKVDIGSRLVLKLGQEVYLTKIEFNILCLLMTYPGVVLSKREIYSRIWNCEAVNCNELVTTHIGHLRKKLEDNPKQPVYIKTIRKMGYRFAAK